MGKGPTRIAAAILAGLVVGWISASSAQEAAAAPKLSAEERIRQLEERVQTLERKLEEKESAQAQAVQAQLEGLDQKMKTLEREKELDKEAADAKAKETPVLTWKDGFTIKTPDNRLSLRLGGRVAYDLAFFRQDADLKYSVGDEQDGTGIRSARIRINGTAYENVDFQAEYEFAGESGADTPSFKDTYVQFSNIPYFAESKGNLRIGHFREPFSLEELGSLRDLTFLERSLMNVFVPSRNPGIQWSSALLGPDKQQRLTYAVGVFKTADDWPSSNDSDEDQGYTVTARLTGLPWYEYNGEHLLHLGAAYSRRNPDGAVLGWNTRPETRLTLFRYANADAAPTPTLYRLRDARADNVNLFNLEAALVYGPFSLQGEYTRADVDTTFDGQRKFSGYYAQASYFLTGEHRPYRNEAGVFDRVRPKHNFAWGKPDGGWGAWELALRYGLVDLSDGGIHGGEQGNLTAGVNWYLNPSTRITLNYIRNNVDHDLYQGAFDTLELRVLVDF